MDVTAGCAGLSDVSSLSEHELVARVRSLNADGNRLVAKLLVHLGEMDARKLYKRHACSSMFAFCRRLGMSEGSTARRLDSARAIRRFPKLLPLVERGELHLTALSIVSGILTPDNVDSVIPSVRGKSRREVEEVRVRYAPRPDVKDMIRKQPQPALNPAVEAAAEPATVPMTTRLDLETSMAAATSTMPVSIASAPPVTSEVRTTPFLLVPEQRPLLDAVAATVAPVALETPRVPLMPLSVVSAPPLVAAPAIRIARPVAPIVPIREDGYKVQFMANKAIVDKIDHLKAIMRHRNPKGDLAPIVEAALDLLIAKVEKERFGKTSRPQKVERPCKPGHVSAAKRREVFERDGIQCTWTDAEGHRCTERGWLELDHVRAQARGGSEAVKNLRVLCRAHNELHATLDFGADHIEQRIAEARRARDALRADRRAATNSSTATGGGTDIGADARVDRLDASTKTAR